MKATLNGISFHRIWVRKLIGKPVAATTPDCEFDARRIHNGNNVYEICLSFLAAESNAMRIQSDLLCGDLAIAACISLFSSGESLALTIIPRSLAFATFGLPIFGFIKSLCKTKIIVDKV
jgi:hypothetical protein